MFLKWSIVSLLLLAWCLTNQNFQAQGIEFGLKFFQESTELTDFPKKLQECGEYCASCDSFYCYVCIIPEMMRDETDTRKCICSSGSYCDYSNTCIDCSSGFYAYCDSTGYGCLPCRDKCSKCSSYNSCLECTQPDQMNIINGQGNCECKKGYTVNPDNNSLCISCPNLCTSCSSLTQCNTCQENAELGSDLLCKCNDAYYLNSLNKCVAYCYDLCTSCSENDGNFCYGCVSNAELKSNSCSCTDNSDFDFQTKACVCSPGFSLSYNKCVSCKKYLSNGHISSAFFSSSMSFIFITFYVDIDTTIDAACNKVLFEDSLEKMGKNPICRWIDSRTLRISLGFDFTQRTDEILLNGLYIVKSGKENCTVDYEPLTIKPQLVGNIYPKPILSGPIYFCLCSNDPLIFNADLSTGFIGSSFTYAWSATLNPANPLVSSKVAESKDSTVYISQAWFSSYAPVIELNITLTLTNILGLTSNSTMTTKIVKEDVLSVQFDQGSSMTLKASDQITLKPRIIRLCSDSIESINWLWTYKLLNSSNNWLTQIGASDKFTIYQGFLEAGQSYMFYVTASQVINGITVYGNASILIDATSSPLYFKLSRSSGDISPNRYFDLRADQSFDPDFPSSPIYYSFSCENRDHWSECLDSNGEKLFTSKDFSSISIPSSILVKGANWDITAKIYKDERLESNEIHIHVLSENSNTTVEIPTDNLIINSDQVNIFSAAVLASQGSELWWSQIYDISARSVKISPNNLPTISFPAGTFRQGETYTFQLIVMENNVFHHSLLNITTNLGAVCRKSTSISPDAGRGLADMFTISIFGCYDRDDSNYPLHYTFQDEWNGLNYTLGYTSQCNSVNTYLFSGKNRLISRVCDQLLTCSNYPLEVTIMPYDARLWQNSSIWYAYWQKTIDTDNIPSSITLFCNMANIDAYIFSRMWIDLQNYVDNNIVTNSILSSILDSVLALTLQRAWMNDNLYHDFFKFIEDIFLYYPSLVPTVEDFKKIVLIGENYCTYGRDSKYKNQSFGNYIIKLDTFYHLCIGAATSLDLVTQSSLDGSQNTEQVLIYNYKNFPNKWLNQTMNLGSAGSIKFPSSLSFADTNIMNFRAIYYNTSNEDNLYSNIISLGFYKSGDYSNFALSMNKDIEIPYASPKYPFTVELQIHKNIEANRSLNCFFYDGTTWNSTNYCNITKISNSSVTFTVGHLSMYKISYENKTLNPTKDAVDKHYYAPVIILVGTIVSPFILIPMLMFCDFILHKIIDWNKKLKEHRKNATKIDSQDPDMQSNRSNIIRSPQENVDNWTETSFAKHDNNLPEEEVDESNCKKFETVLEQLIEGHLVLGFLVLYRSNFSRLLKLFTIMTVILLELFLEGLFFYIYEDTETPNVKSTESLFVLYKADYFLYTVYALLITFPIELLMLMTLCIKFSVKSFWFRFSVALGIVLLAGSISGIIVLNNIYIKRSWCGFWAIGYLYGALIEIFGIQIVWMILRYFFVYYFTKEPK